MLHKHWALGTGHICRVTFTKSPLHGGVKGVLTFISKNVYLFLYQLAAVINNF